MKKILFVFVILLMVSCSGNGVPLAEAELEDFCSRENAGKKIFIGHKGEAAGSVDLSFSGLFTILQMNAQREHPMFSFCENITIEKLDNGDVYLRRPVGRGELGLVFHFTEDKAVIISGDATMFGLHDCDAFNVITLVFSMMTGMDDEEIMTLNAEDLFK